MNKLPAFQFYVGDWRKDPGVQALDFHDRGVWFEILCLMHESDQRGVLLLNGKAMPDSALARLLGLPLQDLVNQNSNQISQRGLTSTLTTLIEFGVASRDEQTGALVCRRMVRDEEIRQTRKECGKLGGNPNLSRSGGNLVNQKSTTEVNQKPTPSSSVSTSSSSSKKEASVAAPPATGSKHPAVEAYRRVNYRYPAAEDMQKIIDAVGDDIDTYSEALTEWRAKAQEHNEQKPNRKWNPAGVDAGLDMYLERKAELGFNAQTGNTQADVYYGPPIA